MADFINIFNPKIQSINSLAENSPKNKWKKKKENKKTHEPFKVVFGKLNKKI